MANISHNNTTPGNKMTPEQKEVALLEGEIATRQHIKDVSDLLLIASGELATRARLHDSSKLGEVEHEKFSLAAARFKEPGNEYGTEGYSKTKEWLGEALQHHYANNSHHPEHYENGIAGMNLFDVLEMLIDWKAASARRSADGLLDLTMNKENHSVSDEVMQLMINTADHLGFKYK